MKKHLLLVILGLIQYVFYSQTNFDSLWGEWNNIKNHDTVRINALHDYSWNKYMFTSPDSAFYYAQLAEDFCKENNLKVKLSKSNKQGEIYFNVMDCENAIKF